MAPGAVLFSEMGPRGRARLGIARNDGESLRPPTGASVRGDLALAPSAVWQQLRDRRGRERLEPTTGRIPGRPSPHARGRGDPRCAPRVLPSVHGFVEALAQQLPAGRVRGRDAHQADGVAAAFEEAGTGCATRSNASTEDGAPGAIWAQEPGGEGRATTTFVVILGFGMPGADRGILRAATRAVVVDPTEPGWKLRRLLELGTQKTGCSCTPSGMVLRRAVGPIEPS